MTKEEREVFVEVLNLVSPWQTHCDYRAEEHLQEACRLMRGVLYPDAVSTRQK